MFSSRLVQYLICPNFGPESSILDWNYNGPLGAWSSDKVSFEYWTLTSFIFRCNRISGVWYLNPTVNILRVECTYLVCSPQQWSWHMHDQRRPDQEESLHQDGWHRELKRRQIRRRQTDREQPHPLRSCGWWPKHRGKNKNCIKQVSRMLDRAAPFTRTLN